MIDLLITGAKVVDGTGGPWYRGNVAIREGRIVHVGPGDDHRADRIIEADGWVVAPGFIDVHSHSDLMLLQEPTSPAKIMQGVTTEVLGQDGIAPAPMRPEHEPQYRRLLSGLLGDPEVKWSWRGLDDYLDNLEQRDLALNVCSYIPYGNLRMIAMNGSHDREPTPAEMDTIISLLSESFRAGGFALSTGLVYPPCCYSSNAEMTRVARAVAEAGGFLVVHQRSEGAEVLESFGELVGIARETRVPLHISHLKVAGRGHWHKCSRLLARIDDARAEGIDVTFDQYPYTAGSTMLSAILPPWAHDGGSEALLCRLRDGTQRARIKEYMENVEIGWDNMAKNAGWAGVVISSMGSCKNRHLVGKNLDEVGRRLGKHPADAAMDLLLEEDNAVGMITFLMRERDVAEIMKHPAHMVCTDGLLGGRPHPRVHGSFPRVLARYVRRERVLGLEDAVRRMTGFPAQRLGLHRRGLLKPGFWADVVVFDPEEIEDTATYDNPRQFPEGIEYVIVNGHLVVDKGQYTGAAGGQVLRFPG